MKYIVITCCLLAGCSMHDAQREKPQPHQPASPHATETAALPANVQAAVSVLLADRPYGNEGEVQKAAQLLHSFEESVPGIVETLVNQEGEYSTAVTHTFPKAGIAIHYHSGKVTGASRIENRTGTSNQPSDRTR